MLLTFRNVYFSSLSLFVPFVRVGNYFFSEKLPLYLYLHVNVANNSTWLLHGEGLSDRVLVSASASRANRVMIAVGMLGIKIGPSQMFVVSCVKSYVSPKKFPNTIHHY